MMGFYSETCQTARKEHLCEMCGKKIKPGEPFDTHRNTLTVAHLNHTPEDVRPENLCAMCAPCHLRYDAQHHAETRRRRMAERWQSVRRRSRTL